MRDVVSHTISALVNDKPGVLARVVGMFRRRGFNIASLSVGPSELFDLSRMTFVVVGNASVLEQVTKQLYKLIDVVQVTEIRPNEIVSRELALIKVKVSEKTRAQIVKMAGAFNADIIDTGPSIIIIEITGDGGQINSLTEQLKPFGVREVIRTGRVAMMRGSAATADASVGRVTVTTKSAADTEVVP